MARDDLTHDPPCTAGATAIDDYVAALGRGLRGPAAMRRAILDELRDGLLEAESGYRVAGLPAHQATAEAIAEFGDPGTVAAAFAHELATRHARRVAFALVRSGPLIGVSWGLAALASGLAVGQVAPWRWPVPGVQLALPVISLAIAISLAGAALTIAATGPWHALARRPTLAVTAATIIAASAVVCDLTLLALLIASAAAGLAAWPAAVAAIASLARLGLAANAARRLVEERIALG